MIAMSSVEKSETESHLTFEDLFEPHLTKESQEKKFLSKTKEIYATEKVIIKKEKAKEIKSKLTENGWYNFFKKKLKNGEIETWIDFESEIEELLIRICHIFKTKLKRITIKKHDNRLLKKNKKRHEGYYINDDFWIQFGAKSELYKDTLNFFNITSKGYLECPYPKDIEIINEEYFERYNETFTGFNKNAIRLRLERQLLQFQNIFSLYVSLIIDELQPRKKLIHPKEIDFLFDSVFSFNYSNTFEKIYPEITKSTDIYYLHGNARKDNIVLGIGELSKELIEEEMFSFSKIYQTISRKTDYKFLEDIKPYKDISFGDNEIYHFIIYGHSMNESDKFYVKELFNFTSESHLSRSNIKLLFHNKPEKQIKNIMKIIGEKEARNAVIGEELKIDTESPDIYRLNFESEL